MFLRVMLMRYRSRTHRRYFHSQQPSSASRRSSCYQITSKAHFANDLGLDSLDTVEVVMAIEEVGSLVLAALPGS